MTLLDPLRELTSVIQALVAGVFTWGITALGAALVVFARHVNQRLLDAMLGFAVMMALGVALG